jgi:hypothetical protein
LFLDLGIFGETFLTGPGLINILFYIAWVDKFLTFGTFAVVSLSEGFFESFLPAKCLLTYHLILKRVFTFPVFSKSGKLKSEVWNSLH